MLKPFTPNTCAILLGIDETTPPIVEIAGCHS